MSPALAAVLCTAMVCGTCLVWRWLDVLHARAYANATARKALEMAQACADGVKERDAALMKRLAQVETDFETLRAQVALRSL